MASDPTLASAARSLGRPGDEFYFVVDKLGSFIEERADHIPQSVLAEIAVLGDDPDELALYRVLFHAGIDQMAKSWITSRGVL